MFPPSVRHRGPRNCFILRGFWDSLIVVLHPTLHRRLWLLWWLMIDLSAVSGHRTILRPWVKLAVWMCFLCACTAFPWGQDTPCSAAKARHLSQSAPPCENFHFRRAQASKHAEFLGPWVTWVPQWTCPELWTSFGFSPPMLIAQNLLYE